MTLADQREVPTLIVSPGYEQVITGYQDTSANEQIKLKETIQYAHGQVKDTEWFTSTLQQRYSTLRATMTIIVTLQRDFFPSGNIIGLHPTTLKDVTELARLDTSTISRVNNNRYV